MKNYAKYCNNYDSAETLYKQKIKKSRDFEAFVNVSDFSSVVYVALQKLWRLAKMAVKLAYELLATHRKHYCFKWDNKSIVFIFTLFWIAIQPYQSFVRLMQMWVNEGVILVAKISFPCHSNAMH